MKNIKNSVIIFLHRKGRTLLKVLAVVLFVYFISRKFHCMVFRLENAVCISITGRMANAMFQEAFLYSFSKKRHNSEVVFSSENPLADIFTLDGLNWRYDNTYSCSCYSLYQDKWNCAYDESLENLKLPLQVWGFFQSWKYFKGDEEEIRRMFTFQPRLQKAAKDQLETIVASFANKGVTEKTVLVGVHVRRGDYVNKKEYFFIDYGYNVATEAYIHNAITFFQEKYQDVLFIVCGNGVAWAREVMKSYERVHFVNDISPPRDMALLTRTHHTIMTVGTFGWWIGWLTNGTTVYYKNTYQEGTHFSKEFNGGTKDHFIANWIGLD
ncbi:galactoside alpha-(1,2)-fucosyltransferase 2-like [Saccostrea cucullata]|uniref:galactoside alpha-(1,2)-fucosyltransferase 2-like n=1 Tax=Saccostrea cuccullata TaxID=36930 RepID=UPI002ED4FA34